MYPVARMCASRGTRRHKNGLSGVWRCCRICGLAGFLRRGLCFATPIPQPRRSPATPVPSCQACPCRPLRARGRRCGCRHCQRLPARFLTPRCSRALRTNLRTAVDFTQKKRPRRTVFLAPCRAVLRPIGGYRVDNSALGELRTLARLVQADLLTLHLTGVAGDKAACAQGPAVGLVVSHERAGDTVADGAGLA